LQEQAKQPKIIIDNTTDTDRRVMDMVTSFFNFGPSLLRGLKNILLVLLGIIVLLIVASIAFSS
jgi:hypothetical protein